MPARLSLRPVRSSSILKENLVVGIGEALWDVFPDGKKLGGAPANFAYHCSRFGIDSLAVSALGDDPLGAEIASALREKVAINMPLVPYPTGTVQVSLDERGVPSYNITEGVAWDHIPLTEDLLETARHCQAACFGTLAQRSPESRAAIQAFLDAMPSDSMKIFDINLRQHYYSKELVEQSLEKCNILKINDEELEIVGRMFDISDLSPAERCRRIRTYFGLGIVILTCGTSGSHVFADGVESSLPTPEVAVVDTVGAGDSFTAAFCSSLLLGDSIPKAHEKAVALSAYVCTQSGAMPPIPSSLLSF